MSTTPIAPVTIAAIPPARLAQIKKTAQQFEAIFVRQMLSAARKSSFGDNMTSSKGADSFLDMQDSRFADIASQKSAFGLAHMIEKQLERRELNPGHFDPPPLGEVAARRADGGGDLKGKALPAHASPSAPSVSLREPPPPVGEDFRSVHGDAPALGTGG